LTRHLIAGLTRDLIADMIRHLIAGLTRDLIPN
jgi:hypothetical protein